MFQPSISYTLLAVLLVHLAAVWRLRIPPLHPAGLFPATLLGYFLVGTATLVDLPESFSLGLFGRLSINLTPQVLAGYAAYLAGSGLGTLTSGGALARGTHASDWRPVRVWTILVGLTLAGLASFGVLVALIGVPALSGDPAVRQRVNDHAVLNILLLTATVVAAAIGTIWAASSGAATRRDRHMTWALCGTLLLCEALLATRTYVVASLVVGVALWSLVRRPLGWRVLMLGGAVGIVVIGVTGWLRDAAITEEATSDLMVEAGIPPLLVPMSNAYFYVRYTVAGFARLVDMVPATSSYHYGSITLSPIATLLPGRQLSWDIYFKELLGLEFEGAGLPTTLLGSLWADGGWTALVLGTMLAGFVASRTYRIASAPSAAAWAHLLYAWVWYSLLWSIYSNLLPYVTTLTTPLIILVCAWYAGARSQPVSGLREAGNRA